MAKNDVYSVKDDFEGRDWSPLSPQRAFGVYGLALHVNHPNPVALASEASYDQPDDKKVDFLWIDSDRQVAFVGQSYLAQEWGKPEGKANKASSLAIAVSNLVDTPLKELPIRLRPKAEDLRNALEEKSIRSLEVLYVHNGLQSVNVNKELRTAARLIDQSLRDHEIAVRVHELSLDKLQELFDSIDKEILVEDRIELPAKKIYKVKGDDWRAVVTALPGKTLNEMKSFDLRSRDPVQKRLRAEFEEYSIQYAHRRGASKRYGAVAIHAAVVAPLLAAFHSKFQIAIRQRAEIFEQDPVYNQVFPSSISAGHVYLIQCLGDAFDAVKRRLKEEVKKGEPTGLTAERFNLMDHSTSKYFIHFVIGQIAEQLVGHRVTDRHAWRSNRELLSKDRSKLTSAWEDVLEKVLPRLAKQVREDSKDAVRSTERGKEVAEEIALYIESNRKELANAFGRLREWTTFDDSISERKRASASSRRYR